MNSLKLSWIFVVSFIAFLIMVPGFAAGYLAEMLKDAFKAGGRASHEDAAELQDRAWAL